MAATTLIHRGDVFWVESEDASRSPGIRHPHVVVQDDVFNHSRIPTLVMCALTSNLQRASEPGNVQLEPGEANLVKRSVVVVSQVCVVARSRLGQYIGSLSQQRVEQVLDGMRFQQKSFFQRG
jgi:mRNA interferase MazF